MDDRKEIRQALFEVLGEEGCGATCDEADIFQDEDGWNLNLCGFMEPWKVGKTVEEVRESVKRLGAMGFGLS